jgi:hypothetical protein
MTNIGTIPDEAAVQVKVGTLTVGTLMKAPRKIKAWRCFCLEARFTIQILKRNGSAGKCLSR